MNVFCKILTIVAIIFFADILQKCQCYQVRFTNIICNLTDPSFGRVNKCDLKAVSRSIQYFSASATVFELPVTDMEVRIQFMKRLSGWKPFLYDFTIRCNFTRQLNKLQRLIWDTVRHNSNIQHDCPYNQTFELTRVDNTNVYETLKLFPLPLGKYGLLGTIKTNNIVRGSVNFQVEIV